MSKPYPAVVTAAGVKLETEQAREEFRADVHARYGLGEIVLLHVSDYQDLRSLRANNYLWGVVYKLIAEDTGHRPDEIHDAMCELFLPNERKRIEFFNKLTGQKLRIEADRRRSSKLTGGPFYDFVEEVRQWALDFRQIVTPDPNPEYWRKRGKAAA